MATTKEKNFAEKVFERLGEETVTHFIYHKVFRAGIKPNDKPAIEALISQEYLNGMSFEDYAVTKVIEGIEKEMGRHKIPNAPAPAQSKGQSAGAKSE